jgi:hypothetical protein
MKKLIVMLVSGLLMATTAYSQTKPVYVCDIKDSVALTDTGLLKPSGYSDAVKNTLKQIIFDENTGIIRGTGTFKLEVVQQKAEGNGLIARREHHGYMVTVIQVLSISTWRAQTPFTYYDAGVLYSGTCRILH